MHTILIAHQQPTFKAAMGRAIDAWAADHPTGPSSCPREVMETNDLGRTFGLIQTQPKLDLILIDPSIPGMHGMDSLLRLRSTFPEVPVALIWDGCDQQMALQSVACGARGVISKSASTHQLDEAISHMLQGGLYLPPDVVRTAPHHPLHSQVPAIVPAWLQRLTRCQLRVLERMRLGESNKQIAWSLGIAESTVKTHVSMILQKLGVHNRVQAVLMAHDLGSVSVSAMPTPGMPPAPLPCRPDTRASYA